MSTILQRIQVGSVGTPTGTLSLGTSEPTLTLTATDALGKIAAAASISLSPGDLIDFVASDGSGIMVPIFSPDGGITGQVIAGESPSSEPFTFRNTLFVAAGGSDTNPGNNLNQPLATFQRAIDIANTLPGQVVIEGLGAGTAIEDLVITNGNIIINAPGWALIRATTGDAITVNLTSGIFNITFLSINAGGPGSNALIATVPFGPDCYLNVIEEIIGNVNLNNVALDVNLNATTITGSITVPGGGVNVNIPGLVTNGLMGRPLTYGSWHANGRIYGTQFGNFFYNSNSNYPRRYERFLTGNYTMSPGDQGTLLLNNTTNTYTVTLPLSTSVIQGYEVEFINLSTGSISFATQSSDTIIGSTNISGVAQRVKCTLLSGTTWEIDAVGTGMPLNLPGIFVSQYIGNDVTGTGSISNPFATFGRAVTAAGAPSQPTTIFGLDGAIYPENLTINYPNIFFNAPEAQLSPSSGAALTFTAAMNLEFVEFALISSGSGPVIVATYSGASPGGALIKAASVQGGVSTVDSTLIFNCGATLIGNNTVTGSGAIAYVALEANGTNTGDVKGLSGQGSTFPQFSVNSLNVNSTYNLPTTAGADNQVISWNPLAPGNTQWSNQDLPNLPGVYFSQTTGNDSTGDGTIGNPYATIGKAVSMVTNGSTVYGLDNATYAETLTYNNQYFNFWAPGITIAPTTGPGIDLLNVQGPDPIIVVNNITPVAGDAIDVPGGPGSNPYIYAYGDIVSPSGYSLFNGQSGTVYVYCTTINGYTTDTGGGYIYVQCMVNNTTYINNFGNAPLILSPGGATAQQFALGSSNLQATLNLNAGDGGSILSYTAIANASTYTVNTQNASFGQSTTLTIPDPGTSTANYALTSNSVTAGDLPVYNTTTGVLGDSGIPANGVVLLAPSGDQEILNHALIVDYGVLVGNSSYPGYLQMLDGTTGSISLQFIATPNASTSYIVAISNASFGQNTVLTIVDPGVTSGVLPTLNTTTVGNGNIPTFSGTTGVLQDSGVALSSLGTIVPGSANYLAYYPSAGNTLQAALVTAPTSGNIVTTIDSAALLPGNLSSGGQVVIIAPSSVTASYKLVNIMLNGVGATSYSGGNRDLAITDGVTVYTVIPASTMMALVNNDWGSVNVPWPASSPINAASLAGGAIYATYSGGTTDYTIGSVVITLVYDQVAY